MKYLYWVLIGSVLIMSCQKPKNSHKTTIIAHRGFSEIAPENTLIAFKKAIEIGTPYFELDVHQSKDGELMVIHDYSVNRTTSNKIKGKIKEMTFGELQHVNVGYSKKFEGKYSTEKIPTLKDALLLAKGKIKVCVEIKVKNVEVQVVKLIEELNRVDQVIVFAFNFNTIKKVKELNPKIKSLFLKDNATIKTIDRVVLANLDAIGVWHKKTEISKEFIDYAHNRNIEVFTYTVNDVYKMKKLINLKIDGIITNRPNLALNLINKQ